MSCGSLGPTGFIRLSYSGFCQPEPELWEVPVPAEEKEMVSVTMPPSLPILERFSSFTRLTRVTAWLFRFVNNCRKTGGCKLGPLLVDELLHAEMFWIPVVQWSAFLEKILV